jgi:perosamine synthetase
MTQRDDPIPWWEPRLGEAVKRAVADVVDSAYINDGPVTRELERRIAALAGVRHGVAVNSCTTGLALALMAAGVGPGDEVIVPDLTFIATANAVRLAGADVKLVDIEPDRLAISVERAAATVGPRTKAVVPVDVNGRAVDYDGIEALCRQRGLALIADSAEGLGCRHRGRPLGSFGRAAGFSFSAHKLVFAGQGGVVVTDEDEMHVRLRELRDHGRRTPGTGGDDLHPVLGFNFKYPNLMAAVVLAQLDELDERLAHARARDRWYRELLAGCPGVAFPGLPPADGETALWADALFEGRDRVTAALAAAKIGFRPFWFPLHCQRPYRASDNEFPNAIAVSSKGLWLPSALSLTRADAERVARVIRSALES